MSLKYLHVLEFSITTVSLNVIVRCIDSLLERKIKRSPVFHNFQQMVKRLQNQNSLLLCFHRVL